MTRKFFLTTSRGGGNKWADFFPPPGNLTGDLARVDVGWSFFPHLTFQNLTVFVSTETAKIHKCGIGSFNLKTFYIQANYDHTIIFQRKLCQIFTFLYKKMGLCWDQMETTDIFTFFSKVRWEKSSDLVFFQNAKNRFSPVEVVR